MSKGKPRLDSLQVIRAIAFMLIFLAHANILPTGSGGVSIFLVLSGFCMTYSYLDRPEKMPGHGMINNVKFAWGKIKKLYPLHLITLLFVAAVIFGGLFLHHASRKELAEQGGYFVANLLLLQSWIPWRDGYYSFNAVSWYLSTTAFLYFIFPLVFKIIQTKDTKRILTLLGIVLGSMIAIAALLGIGKTSWGWPSGIIKWIIYICPLYRAGDFIIGLIAGYFFITRSTSTGTRHTAAQIAVVLAIAAQYFIYHAVSGHGNWMLTLFWLPGSVLCIYLFAENNGLVSEILTKSKVLIGIGNISAEAFLIHQICVKMSEYITKNKWVAALIAAIATVIATLIWRWLYDKVYKALEKKAAS